MFIINFLFRKSDVRSVHNARSDEIPNSVDICDIIKNERCWVYAVIQSKSLGVGMCGECFPLDRFHSVIKENGAENTV